MASWKEIKRKISSIKNTWKITKAMELISTVKMKKAVDSVMAKKEFVLEMLKIFTRIESNLKDFPFFNAWKWQDTLWIIITSNKWLCGWYNINVMKKVNSYMKESPDEKIDFISVWKKAARFVAKTWNNLIADFSYDFTDNLEPVFTTKISRLIRDEFLSWKYKKIVIFYNYFVNTISQVPVSRDLLPIEANDIKNYLLSIAWKFYDIDKELSDNSNAVVYYEIEPSREELANHVIPLILDMMFYDMFLEAKASEHASRMVAMKWAKDNAKKIASALTLKYNKARQSMITKEVSEITAWVESLKD